jgi:type I restriction enzyme S subunit
MSKETRIGFIPDDFGSFVLRDKLTRNDAGDWGAEPQDSNTCGVLRSTNFTNEGILNLDDVARRSLSQLKRKEKSLQQGDIVIERSGGSEDQPVGRVGYISAEIAGYGFSFSNFIQRISLDLSLNPKYVFYCLQRMHELGITIRMQTQTTGIRNLHYRLYSRSVLPEPKRSEQDKIVFSLEWIDSAITAVKESITKAERLQMGLMQNLLTGRLKPDGTLRNPDEMQATKLGLLPKTWSVARIKDFGEVSTGKTPPTANETNFGTSFPFITPGDLGITKWIRQTERSLSAVGAEFAGVLPANAVCVVCIGATIGKAGLTVQPACTNQQIHSVVCSEAHSPQYLYSTVRHRAHHLQAIAGINATPQLNKTGFSKYRIPMPATPKEEDEIGNWFAAFDDLVEAKERKIGALQDLKKSLMQNLLTGRIRLSVESTEKKEATA